MAEKAARLPVMRKWHRAFMSRILGRIQTSGEALYSL